MKSFLSLLLPFILLFQTPSMYLPLANTYYVAMDGLDSNNGSASAPWRTLQHAVDHVLPGDTILVHTGTYLGARLESSGQPNEWITLKAAPNETVVINAPGPGNKHNSNIELETWEGAGTVAYWVIEDLEVRDAPSWGIDVRGNDAHKSHHILLRGNRVHHNGVSSGRTGIFAAFTDDVTIENNESYSNGEHGIYVNNSSDRFTVRGNRLHHNAGCGLHLNGDLSMGGDGVMSSGLIENNLIYENGQAGGAGINMDGVNNTMVRNNLLYSNHASGVAIFQGDGALCSQGNTIYHNTIVMPADGRWAVTLGGSGCINNKIVNNILYSYHSYRGSINLPVSNLSGFESDYNVVVNRFTLNDGSSVIGLAAWQALGYDLHSTIHTPSELFIDVGASNFHLRGGSPAIDTGRADLNIFGDLENFPRPSGAGFDRGAYEYQFASLHPIQAFLPILAR